MVPFLIWDHNIERQIEVLFLEHLFLLFPQLRPDYQFLSSSTEKHMRMSHALLWAWEKDRRLGGQRSHRIQLRFGSFRVRESGSHEEQGASLAPVCLMKTVFLSFLRDFSIVVMHTWSNMRTCKNTASFQNISHVMSWILSCSLKVVKWSHLGKV